MSDSSSKGYAVHATSISADEIKPLIAAPERARFATREDAPPPDDAPFAGAMPGPRLPMDDILDEIPRRPRRRGPRRPRVLIRTGFNLVPLPDDFVAADRWVRVVRGAWRCPGKIHALEARATLFGLKKASIETIAHGRVLFSVGDNLSSILAYEKGRARCEDLLAQCRTAAAYLIGAQIRWHHRHVESERNVTDFDSRAADRGEIARGHTQSVYGSLQSILSKSQARGRNALPHGAERPPPAAPVPVPPPSEPTASLPPKRKSPAPGTSSSRSTSILLKRDSLPAHEHVRPSLAAPPGLEHLRPLVPVLAHDHSRPERVRTRYFLEIFSGCGRLSGALVERGLAIMCPIDIEKGAWHDMTCKRLQRLILTWVRGRRLWLIHLGTPCTRWSSARTTGVVEPNGGLECALFTVRLLRACRQAGVCFTLENPRASALWKWEPLALELRRSSALCVNFPQCQYTTPPTKSRRPSQPPTTPSTPSLALASAPSIENDFKG